MPNNFPAVGGGANCFASPPMMCSTQAYSAHSVPAKQSLGAVSDNSSDFGRGSGAEVLCADSAKSSSHNSR